MKKMDQKERNHPMLTPKQEIQQWNDNATKLHYLNPRLGLHYAMNAYELSVRSPNSSIIYRQGMAESLYNLSHFNFLLGNLHTAVEQAEESLRIYQKLNQELPEAELYAHLGKLYDILNQRNLAIDYLVKGLEISKKNQFELTEAKINLYMGTAYTGMGNYRQCIPMLLQANDVFIKLNQPVFQTYALINLAQAYAQSKIEESFCAIQASLDLAKQIGSPVILAEALYYQGKIRFLNGEIELAKTDFLHAQKLNKKIQMKYLNLRIKHGLSDIFIVHQEFQKASLLLGKCLKMAKTIGIEQLIIESHQKLSNVYESMEKYFLSLTHFKHYSDLSNDFFKKQSLQKEQAIEVLYRTRSAAKEIDLTREKNLALEQEILERKKIEAELRKSEKRYCAMATIDPLTHLYNRRHFYYLAEIEFERAVRYGHPLSVLMIDLDHFKEINDHYGHLVGDEMLEFVAGIFKRNLRKVDIIGRYGGEEFIVLLPQTNMEQALTLANRICNVIRDTSMPTNKGLIAVTISMGVGALSSHHESLDSLMDKADQAMYTAKNIGRNQVFLSPN